MKPKKATDPIEDFDLSFSPDTSMRKLPTDVSGGLEPLSDFMNIPCNRIVPYQNKKDSDFKAWSEDSFQLLVSSIRESGVLEPITVRPYPKEVGFFELLAGEHRWKASIEAGKAMIPARVMRKCDDDMAGIIFSVTNLLRRENSIRDKINGWWHFLSNTRYKREFDLKQMIEEGLLSGELLEQRTNRSIYRYAKMHDLIEEFLLALENKRLSVKAAEQISFLSSLQQHDLLPYIKYLKDLNILKSLRKLSEDNLWSAEKLEELFAEETIERETLTLQKIIKNRIPKEYRKDAYKIIDRALLEFFERGSGRGEVTGFSQ